MELVHCKECGVEIYEDAKICPKCGYRIRKDIFERLIYDGLIFFLVIIFLFIFGMLGFIALKVLELEV